MKRLYFLVVLILLLPHTLAAEDLFKVTLHSQMDADLLNAMNADILLAVRGGYLLLADDLQETALQGSNLDIRLLAEGVQRNQLVLDGRFDRRNAEVFQVVYEEDALRVLLVDDVSLTQIDGPTEIIPIMKGRVKVAFHPPLPEGLPSIEASLTDDLSDLIARVDQGNLEDYVLQLQSFFCRAPGTAANVAARDWIYSKFAEFGYDSVYLDPFTGLDFPDYYPCPANNVVATKIGTLYPDRQVIFGAHFDAVPDSPGANDNASGAAAVLEIARILADIETEKTIIFIAFDNEETGLLGSSHYAGEALAHGDDIAAMVNVDMIAHEENSDEAYLFYGTINYYAQIWDELANMYVGIDGILAGSKPSSDHFSFQQTGYDVVWAEERIRSTHWHLPSDSTVYMDFDYMTRMVKATTATLYAICKLPHAIVIEQLRQSGDGSSVQANWQSKNDPDLAEYRLGYFRTDIPWQIYWMTVPPTDTCCLVAGLTEGVEYGFFVQAVDNDSRESVPYNQIQYMTPNALPAPPTGVSALPALNAVNISWNAGAGELDLDRCDIIRDGAIIGQTLNSIYTDNDPGLGGEMHSYVLRTVDKDGNQSDTTGIAPIWTKAATLTPDRILAVNRSCVNVDDFVDEVETGVFMREALEGYDFDYYSDTAATMCASDCEDRLDLVDMVDYGVIVIGSEAGTWDGIGVDPLTNGILDTLVYYMSLGGKVIIFGRWGDMVERDTVDYMLNGVSWDNAYHDYFNIDFRVMTATELPFLSTLITSDLIGAKAQDANYPDLLWDSLATLAHANANSAVVTEATGIPCASFVELNSAAPDVIYSYDSRDDDPDSEGKPVAWRYLGDSYSYVWFEIPLSLFERGAAIEALTHAVDELMNGSTGAEQNLSGENLPDKFGLSQNYPNPFNPVTEICYSLPSATKVNLSIFNILGQRVKTLVNEDQVAGSHTVQWPGTDDRGKSVATGIYLYRLTAGEFTESRKMLLLK